MPIFVLFFVVIVVVVFNPTRLYLIPNSAHLIVWLQFISNNFS